jgi:hypothetical protein
MALSMRPFLLNTLESSKELERNMQSTSHEFDDRLQSKGDHVIDLFEIRSMLSDLRPYCHIQIGALQGENRHKFHMLKEYVELLYEHPDKYKQLYGEIKDVFSDIHHCTPGTVGAYFYGCAIASKGHHPYNCCPLCVNGAPLPSSGKESSSEEYCDYNIVWVDVVNGKCQMNVLCRHPDKDQAIVYINKKQLARDFWPPSYEWKHLQTLGIRRVKVFAYDDKRQEYQEIVGDFEDIDVICHGDDTVPDRHIRRVRARGNNKSKNEKNSNGFFGAGMGILTFIIIAAIIIFLIWWFMRQPRV